MLSVHLDGWWPLLRYGAGHPTSSRKTLSASSLPDVSRHHSTDGATTACTGLREQSSTYNYSTLGIHCRWLANGYNMNWE